MKSLKITLFTAFLTLISISLSAQENNINLKIVRGGQDTVFSSKHNIIGNVDPRSEVTINGNSVKVYKTGSFGTSVQLNRGNNKIVIDAFRRDNPTIKESITHNIFYSTERRAVIEERPIIKDTNFNVITKKDAWFNYGTGQDRLGGSKINYLPEGIILQICGIYNDLYKVKLSENRNVYIPASCVDTTSKVAGGSLTGSWTISNIGGYDQVSIACGYKVPFLIKEELNPSRIVVEMHRTTCNSNWITQYLDMEMIDYVDFEQTGTDIFQAIIYLNRDNLWGYSVGYEGTNLVIRIKHAPEPKLKGLVVGLDAGHGGDALGAVSPAGFMEKELNLNMVYMLKEELEKKGAKVVLSRTDDRNMTMAERKEIFLNNNIDILFSIHCNAGGNPFVPMGASTYYKHIHNRQLAKTTLSHMLKLGVKNYGLVGNFNFSLNAPTEYPNVLVETLFLSSLPDEELITDPKFQQQMMKMVVNGLEDYLKQCKK